MPVSRQTFALLALPVGAVLLLALILVWVVKGGEVIDSNQDVAAIIAELQYYSQELAATCIPATANSNLDYARTAKDVKERDVNSVISSDPAKASRLCIQQFCAEVDQNPNASASGLLLAQRLCST